MRTKQLVLTAILTTTIGFASSCVPTTDGGHSHEIDHGQGARTELSMFEYFDARGQRASRSLTFTHLTDLLANTSYENSGQLSLPFPVDAFDSAVVHGVISDVTSGRAFRETETSLMLDGSGYRRPADASADPHRDEVEFGDPNASWWTLVATVDVVDDLGSGLVGPIDLLIPFGGDADPDQMAQELLDLDQVVVAFNRSTDVSSIASPSGRPQFRILGDGRYLGTVEGGQLRFPAVDQLALPAFLELTPTIDALQAAAGAPGYRVQLALTHEDGLVIEGRIPKERRPGDLPVPTTSTTIAQRGDETTPSSSPGTTASPEAVAPATSSTTAAPTPDAGPSAR